MITKIGNKHVLYKQYLDKFYAQEVYTLLKRNNIDAEFGDNIPSFDISFANNNHNQLYEIRLKPSEFSEAEKILINHAQVYLKDLPQDYYMYQMSNEELLSVIKDKNKYSEVDLALAIDILNNKGLEELALSLLANQDLHSIKKSERNIGGYWILLGSSMAVCLLIYLHFIFFLLGISSGMILYNTKTNKGVYKYDEIARRYGLYMVYGVLICTILGFIITLI